MVVVDAADTGVDEHDPFAGADQEAAEGQLEAAVGGDELLVGQPRIVPAAGEPEQVAGGQPGPAVVDGDDFESADSHGRRL